MKVLLIYPPRRSDGYFFPPTSLLYVANAIRAAGHEAQIIDIPYLLEKCPDEISLLDGSLFDHILRQKFDLLGLGGVVSTYFFYEELVKKIRAARKDVPIVVGGSVGAPIRDVWLKHAPVDFLIEGDGEIAIQKLLDYIGGKRDILSVPGLHYARNGRYESNPPEAVADLDSIPFLLYDELDHEYYINELTKYVKDILPDKGIVDMGNIRLLPLLTSRGCPFSCTFCFHFNKTYRYNSTKYVIDYIKLLKQKYRVNSFLIIDDLFTGNRQRTIELCDAIYEAGLGLSFVGSGGKPSLVTREMLDSMKRAGFIRFSYGIESGSQKMLDIMKKGTTVEQNLAAIKLTQEAGLPVTANMIFGMPGENAETLEETKRFLVGAGLNTGNFYGAWATAYPGTPLFEFMKEKGMVSDTRDYLLKVGSIGYYKHNLSEMPLDKIKKMVARIHEDIDIAYCFRNGQYAQYIIRRAARICRDAVSAAIRMVFRGDAEKEAGVRTALLNVYNNFKMRNLKRSKKLANDQVEEWVAVKYGGRVEHEDQKGERS